MTFLRRLASIVRWTFRRNRAEQRLDDELQTYIEMSAAEKMRDGVEPDDARRLARMELGGAEQVKEHVRAERHGHLIDDMGRDLRYGLRMFVRAPGFSAVVVLTLALGIGANTAIFSLIDALMIQSLPVAKPQELLLVNLRERADLSTGGDSFSYSIVRALDEQHDVFSGVGGFSGLSFDVGAAGSMRRLLGGAVTGGFYQTLGIQPAAGRLLTHADDQPGAQPAVVISDSFWEREFGRSQAAIGQSLALNGTPVTIVGVTPQGFSGAIVGQVTELTIAVAVLPQVRPTMAEWLGPGNFWLRVLARPANGMSPKATAARLNAAWPGFADAVIATHWSAVRRKAVADSVFVLESGAAGWTYLREIYTKPLLILMAVAGVVLLIACANVASLFLARASVRQREIAVRLAIGAGRRRIIGQLLIEGALLSFAGAAAGIGVAWFSGRFLVQLISTGPFQVVFSLTPNWHMLAFSAMVACATGAVFGIAPAVHLRHTGPSLALRDDNRTSTRRSKLLPSLVTLQVALALVLVAGAGLFIRTLKNLQHVDPGFSTEGVFVANLERGQHPAPEQLLDVVRRIPGVRTASVTTHTPLDGSSWGEAIVPAGQPMPENDNARLIGTGPAFLETLQITLVAGRDFGDADVAGHTGVAIVNERYASSYFPNQNPVGRHLVSTLMGQGADLEIIGVVKNTTASGLRTPPPPIVYVSFAQFGRKLAPSLVIRVGSGGAQTAEAVRAALQAQLPNVPIGVVPLSNQINRTMVQERILATLASGFGVLALILSAVGLYGLLAYSVAQRSRELGIRMALGASSAGVVTLVLLSAFRLVAAGFVLGYPAAWAASQSIASMLFGLNPADPATMAGAMGVLVCAALIAAYFPARNASRVDPLIALRRD